MFLHFNGGSIPKGKVRSCQRNSWKLKRNNNKNSWVAKISENHGLYSWKIPQNLTLLVSTVLTCIVTGFPPTHCQLEAENWKEVQLLLEVGFLIAARKETAKTETWCPKAWPPGHLIKGPTVFHPSTQRIITQQWF